MSTNDQVQEKLTTAQWTALQVLVGGGDYTGAAEAAQVSLRTVRRWRSSEEFRTELRAEQERAMEAVCHRLSSLTQKTLGMLEAVLDNPKTTDSVRVRAAGMLLDATLRWQEMMDLATRVTKLERNL